MIDLIKSLYIIKMHLNHKWFGIDSFKKKSLENMTIDYLSLFL